MEFERLPIGGGARLREVIAHALMHVAVGLWAAALEGTSENLQHLQHDAKASKTISVLFIFELPVETLRGRLHGIVMEVGMRH